MAKTNLKDQPRIQRLITLAFLLTTNEEYEISELAEQLSITTKELERDLNTLMFVGLPPYSPGELFDIYIEDGYVSMRFNDVFVRPLRLSASEKSQAIVALKKLAAQNNNEDIEQLIEAIDSDLATKIEIEASNKYFEQILNAIENKNKLSINYFSLNSGTISERNLIPLKVFTTASINYLFAYDRAVQQVRIFRLDRIISLSVLDEKFEEIPSIVEEVDPSNENYVIGLDTSHYVDFEIPSDLNWIVDTVPNEPIDEKANLYRFYTNSPVFVARLLAKYPKTIMLKNSTIDKKEIIGALKQIKDRIVQDQ